LRTTTYSHGLSPARRPRIALVGWRLGAELETAIRTGCDRFDFVVVSMSLSEDLRPLVDWCRIPRPKWNSFRLRWIAFFALAGFHLRRMKVDLVHTVGPTPPVPNRVDVNTVTFCHAAYHEAAAPARIKGTAIGWRIGEPAARILERWWFTRRVRVLAGLSEGGAAELRRHYPQAEVVVLSRGVDLERFRPSPSARAQLRAELAVDPDEVIALFVDQDARPLKGLDLAIEAFARARQTEGGPARLWVLGSENERYAPLARELQVEDAVSFFEYRYDQERFYQAADIFVLPTVYETFSRSAHEAAASGLPLIAPPVNGIAELIGADEAGVVARRDPTDIARALTVLSGDAGLRARLGREAHLRAAAFDGRLVAQRALELYEGLLDSGGRDESR
jgi:glycosyltransferase involved in cell wall biosynthesis